MAKPTGATSIAGPRDAIIFVGGIGDGFADRSVVGVGLRLARALDQTAKDEQLTYTFELGTEQTDYAGGSTTAHSIRRRRVDDDASQGEPVIDVYHLNYGETMTDRWKQRNPLSQVILLGLALLATVPRFLQAFFEFKMDPPDARLWKVWRIRGARWKGKSFMQLMQLAYASVVFLGLIVYFVLLVVAAVQVVDQFVDSNTGDAAFAPVLASGPDVTAQDAPADGEPRVTIVQQAVILLTAVGAALRRRRARLEAAIINYLAIMLYLSAAERHGHLVGQLDGLLEHVAEQHDYRRIHIVAYSFGSILVIDALFPGGVAPSSSGEADALPPTRYAKVDALVTVGCPYDFFRTFWPKYFRDRQSRPGVPKRWLNVFSPVDLLGSNFRNDRKLEPPDPEIVPVAGPAIPKNLVFAQGPLRTTTSALDFLLITGLRAHEMYWGADDDVDRNAIGLLVVPELYSKTDKVVYG